MDVVYAVGEQWVPELEFKPQDQNLPLSSEKEKANNFYTALDYVDLPMIEPNNNAKKDRVTSTSSIMAPNEGSGQGLTIYAARYRVFANGFCL